MLLSQKLRRLNGHGRMCHYGFPDEPNVSNTVVELSMRVGNICRNIDS